MAVEGSFRDPHGQVFLHDGVLYRSVEESYRRDYERLVDSGLFARLVEGRLLVDHEEIDPASVGRAGSWRVLRPRRIDFVSHPYEWCFSQLKDAALLTLDVQQKALEHEMSLKDASAYNVQFDRGAPVFIDTLSFECYEEGRPWPAYRQFCRHFVAPLALMAHTDVRLGSLLRTHLDGIPLDLAVRLLPWRARLRPVLWPPLFLHARAEKSYADRPEAVARRRNRKMSRMGLLGLLDNLRSAIRSLNWRPGRTEWGDYYAATNYSPEARAGKEALVASMIEEVAPRRVWDLGANTGEFSRLASERGIVTVAFDVDPVAVENNYRRLREEGPMPLLPLILDLTNPSPALGWAHRERASLVQRGEVDLVLALALVHHLAIGNNLPLERVAAFLAEIGRHLVLEFVPKSDSQVRRLLTAREDVFPHYTKEGLELAFQEHFWIEREEAVVDSERVLYRMVRR